MKLEAGSTYFDPWFQVFLSMALLIWPVVAQLAYHGASLE